MLLIELPHFLDSKTQFFTLYILLNLGFLHLMVPKNRYLKLNMILNEKGSAPSITLRATINQTQKCHLWCSGISRTNSKICSHAFPILIWPITITTDRVTFYKYCCF